MLNFQLSEAQMEIQQQAREFALKEVLPVAWHYDKKDEIPVSILEKAFRAGMMNSDIPKEFGGKGWGLVEGAIITEEIAAACPGIATSIFDNSLGMEPIYLCENKEAQKKYLSDMAKNFKLICFATSEAFMGSDVSGIRCRAKQDGEDYILNGTKFWITNGGIADYMTVFATIDPEKKHDGICAFVVERNWKGVSSGIPIPKMGQRCSNTTGLSFKDVRVPKENVLAGPGQGFILAMKTFSRTRPIIGSFAVGAARSAMEFAVEYIKKRKAFGTRISNFQSLQFKIAEMYQKIETARLLVLKAAWEADNTPDATISASIAKMYATEAAWEVVDEAMQVFGGFGYTKMFPIEKLLRDMRLYRIYEGTSEVQRMILSGHVMNTYQPVMPPMADIPLSREKPLNSGEPVWRCTMCGHVHYGDEAPEECPVCLFPKAAFKKYGE
ncbi:acyl-CoA dehydrogenase family protein [Desulfospira joergensenii]|uniref:acyl-CoA dehydrogenase family protein n=1 Tax=Desulfospira joergensenii TaxID=53329 RepID=UPI0003B5E024|nr:acyl-CoA dehydrogenase family protein [Desulfospira joergensenii]